MALRALIVDDEEFARKNLQVMLEEFCPEVEVIGDAMSKEQAKAIIESSKPDVVFLDIRMPSGTEGFELLEEIEDKDFLVVFVTAFKDYAIRAFNANAVYYLLKPIDPEELIKSVGKIIETRRIFNADPVNYDYYYDSLKNLSNSLLRNKNTSRIAVSHSKGLKLIEIDDINYLEADGNCTTIYFKDGTRFVDSRTLKTYEEILDSTKFWRIHKTYMINLSEISEYLTDEGHMVVLKNKKSLPVARNRVSDFLKLIRE